MFDAKICETLGYYVYSLKDPTRDGEIFYVGKGVDNRCFAHVEEARSNLRTTEKLDRIRAILASGNLVDIDIVRHGLDEKTAFEVEAALIDILNLKVEERGGNEVRGHGSERGVNSIDELRIIYGAEELETDEPILLIKINRLYEKGMSLDQVYEKVRWCWRLNIGKAQKAKYILAVAHGIVRGVFSPYEFVRVKSHEIKHEKDENRVYFNAKSEPDSPYLHKSTKAFGQKGQASPIRYVNI